MLHTLDVLTAKPETETDEAARQREAREKVGSTLHQKWHLNKLIAVGGMGAVYDATHRNGMRGAVKILDAHLSQSAAARKRFLREGRLANQVRHSGAVRVLDDDEAEDGSAYLVMELLTGSTLEALAARNDGKLEAAKAVEYGLQVLDTLAEAHASGIVHRDIKPENLFLTDDGIVKILDFGIAGMVAREGGGSPTLTKAGEIIGTPAYMSPEQARGRWELVDHQSDLFSLGASLFSLLTGTLVQNKAGTVAELLVATITRNARSLAESMPSAPAELVVAIDGALKLAKADRWANAATMRTALEEGYLALTGQAAPPPRAQTPTDPGVVITTPDRVLRMLQTTMNLPRFPRARWVVGLAASLVVGAILASVIAPRGLAVASTEDAAAPPLAMVLKVDPTAPAPSDLDPKLPGATPNPSAGVFIPVVGKAEPTDRGAASSSARATRYQPLYDRRN